MGPYTAYTKGSVKGDIGPYQAFLSRAPLHFKFLIGSRSMRARSVLDVAAATQELFEDACDVSWKNTEIFSHLPFLGIRISMRE